MADAWVGAVGVGIGSAITLIGTVVVQLLGSRERKLERNENHSRTMQERWFEERRDVYLALVGHASKAHDVATELYVQQPDDPSVLEAANERITREHDAIRALYDRVLLYGSKELMPADLAFVGSLNTLRRSDPTEEKLYAHLDAKYNALVAVARRDLGIAPD